MKLQHIIASTALFALAIPMQTAWSQDSSFGAKRFPTIQGSGGVDVSPVDLNGDGHQDLIITENQSGGFSVHLGDGTGNYVLSDSFSNIDGSQAAQIGDINGDGNIDVVIREFINNNVFSFFLGNGDGTFVFDSAQSLGLVGVSEFLLDEVTGDGNIDLIASTFNGGNTTDLHVLTGTGSGANSDFFSSPVTFDVGTSGVGEIATGDVNGDGNADIAVVTAFPDNTLHMYLNDGSGDFSVSAQGGISVAGSAPSGPTIADADGDGNAEVLYSAFGASFNDPDVIGIFPGNGNGTFGAPQTLEVGITGADSILVGDFNGDNAPDILAAQFINDSMIVYAGKGGLDFNAPIAFGSGGAIFDLAVVDANEDGIDDVIAVNIGSDDFTVHVGTATDQFFTSPQFSSIPRGVTDVAAGDLTGNGQIDAVSVNPSAGSVSLLTDFVNGRFVSREDLFDGLSQPSAAAIVDLNNDDINDIVIASRGNDQVVVYLGQGSGVFGTPTSFGVCSGPFRLASDDLNGDGNNDVVTACTTSNNLSVLVGDGSGSFSSITAFAGVDEPQDILVTDLNADGVADIALADSSEFNSAVRVLTGVGDASFLAPVVAIPGTTIATVSAGDVNADGIIDLAAGNLGQGTLVALGTGAGAFGSATQVAGATIPLAIELYDVNGDGSDDVIAIEAGPGRRDKATTVTLSNGDGTFETEDSVFATANGVDAPFAEPGNLRTLTLADVNNDGRQDVLVGIAAAEFPGGLSVNLNQSNVDNGVDSDGDGIPDANDNCSALANTDQRDTDNDGFGNRCDPDLNNDNIVNFSDLVLLQDVFLSTDDNADFNGDGAVNFLDIGIFGDFFLLPPGPGAVVE